MNPLEVINALERILQTFPEANNYPMRFQGGQGEITAVIVERDDYFRQNEIVFHTARG